MAKRARKRNGGMERGGIMVSPQMQRWMQGHGQAKLLNDIRNARNTYENLKPIATLAALPRERILELKRNARARIDRYDFVLRNERNIGARPRGRPRKVAAR